MPHFLSYVLRHKAYESLEPIFGCCLQKSECNFHKNEIPYAEILNFRHPTCTMTMTYFLSLSDILTEKPALTHNSRLPNVAYSLCLCLLHLSEVLLQ